MKHLKKLLSRIPIRFVVTYLLLLFLAVGLSLLIIRAPVRKVETDILSNNFSTLRQKSNMVEEKLGNVEKVACQISNDPFINTLNSPKKGGSFYLDLNSSRNHLLDYRNKLDDDFVRDYFVYYADKGYVVTPDTCYSADFFQSYIMKPQKNENLSSLFQLMKSRHTGACAKSASIIYQCYNINCVCYVMPIPVMNSAEVENVCFLIPTEFFSQIFSRKELSGSSCLQIRSNTGEVIYTQDCAGKDGLRIPSLDGTRFRGDFSENKKIGGQDVTVTCAVSKENRWNYIWVQPQSVAMNDFNSMHRYIALLFTAVMIIGVAIALFLSYFNSRPILHIAKRLTGDSQGKTQDCDTFQNISDSLDSLIQDNHYFEEKMVQQEPLLRNALAGQLLNGSYESYSAVRATCESLGIPLDAKQFLVCVVNFLVAESTEMAIADSFGKISAVKTCFKELTDQLLKGQILYHDTGVPDTALIACFDHEEQITPFIDAVSKLSRTLSEKYGAMVVIGISNPCSHPVDLLKANQEAREALNCVQFGKKQRVVRYAQIPVQKEDYFYPIDLEQRLINAVTLGNTKGLNEIFSIIYNENFEKRSLSASSARNLYRDTLSTCLHLKHKLPAELDLKWELPSESEEKAIRRESFGKVFAVLQSYCEAVSSHKSDRNRIYTEKIMRFVGRHYEDPNLSLTSTAQKFSISSGYLSTFFKEQTGGNFSDYVELVRINTAQEMLKDTSLTIGDICTKVGYNNAKSFRRAFEKIRGVSPSAARQELLTPAEK